MQVSDENFLKTIDEVSEWLNQRFRNDDFTLGEAVGALGEKTRAITILRSVLRDPIRLSNIASMSYRHANGFDKIVLLSSKSPEYKLRLHIWWDRPAAPVTYREDVHNHRWSFASRILIGSYSFQEFQVSPDGEPVFEYEYTSSDDSRDSYDMRFVGTASVKESFSGVMIEGNQYTLSHDVLHRIATRGDLTASLFLTGPYVKPSTRVFRASRISGASKISLKSINEGSLSESIMKLVNLLETS